MAPRLLSPHLWAGCLVIVMVPGVSTTPVTQPRTLVIRVQQCGLLESLSEGCHCALWRHSTLQPLLPDESDPFHGDRTCRTSSTEVGRAGPLPQGSGESDLFRRGRASWTPSAWVGRDGPLPQRSGEPDPFCRGRARRILYAGPHWAFFLWADICCDAAKTKPLGI